jgi:WD repeat-containing protein 61
LKSSELRIEPFVLEGHQRPVYTLSPGRTSTEFLSAGEDRWIVAWREGIADGVTLAQAEATVYSMVSDIENNSLWIGQSNGIIRIVDFKDGKEKKALQLHGEGVFALLKHGDLILSASADGILACTERKTGTLVWRHFIPGGKIRELAVSPDGKFVAFGNISGFLQVCDMETGNLLWKEKLSLQGVNCVLWSKDKPVLLYGTQDAKLGLVDWQSGQQAEQIPAHNYAIYRLKWSPCGRFIASCSRDKTAKIWNPADLSVLLRLEAAPGIGHRHSVNAIYWAEEGNNFYTAGDDRRVCRWDLTTFYSHYEHLV